MAKFLKDEQLAGLIQKDYQWAYNLRKRYIQDWKRLHRLYKAYNDPSYFPYEANLSVPIAFWVIETQLPHILDIIFSNGQFVSVAGKTLKGQMTAPAVEALMEYHFTNSFDIYRDMYEFVKQLLMYGTSIYKSFWKYRVEKRPFQVPIYENNEFVEYKQELRMVEVENKPDGRTIDIYNFGVDPNASCIEDARFAFDEMWLDPVYLVEKQKAGLYRNVDRVLGESFSSDVNSGLQEREDVLNLTSYQKSPYIERGRVHCIDYWGYIPKGFSDSSGKWELKSSEQRLYHIVAAVRNSSFGNASDSIILHAEPTPFSHNRLPYVDARIHYTKGEFYGSGDLEYIESLCLELTDMRNMRTDNLNKTINKMFKVRDNALIDEDELIWRPGGIIHVRNMDDVEVVDPRPIDFSSFRETEEIRRDIEQITGVSDFVAGLYRSSTGFNDTATGISLIQQAALKKVGLKAQIVQRAIRDIAFLTFNLVAQYEPYGTTIRKLMPDDAMRYRFVDVSPQALANSYDWNIVNSPAAGNREMRVQQLIQLLQYLIPLSQNAGTQIDYRAFVRRILKEMDVTNPSELLGFPEFNMEFPQELSDAESAVMYDPETENRMMLDQHEYVAPKYGEEHPSHLVSHMDAFNSTQDNIAQGLLARHIKETRGYMNREREEMAAQLTTAATLKTAQGMAAQKTESPMGAAGTGGMENLVRLLGGVGSGNG